MTPQEMAAETTSVYDNYVEVLETGSVEALQHYARDLSERIIPRGVETHEVVGIVLLLRDVLARSLFEKYQRDFALLNQVLDAYEPAANRIANTVAVSFVDERERVIRQQQDAIRELSTPVLPVRERLLILPIIGVLDSERARQLTEQLLSGIRTHRAKVVVIDITGAPDVDETVANHLVQTVDASRLMGASVIITGLSPDDRPDARDDRRRPEQDEHHRRPAGRPRGGRAAARLPRDPDGGDRRTRELRTGARLDPATGGHPRRVDPHCPGRLRDDPLPGRPRRARSASTGRAASSSTSRPWTCSTASGPARCGRSPRWRGCAGR